MLMMRETIRLGVWLHGPHPDARHLRKEIRFAERKIGADKRIAVAVFKRERRRCRNIDLNLALAA